MQTLGAVIIVIIHVQLCKSNGWGNGITRSGRIVVLTGGFIDKIIQA